MAASKLFFDITISLDGFYAGDNRGPHNPVGDNGTSLHDWMFNQQAFQAMSGKAGGETGVDNKILADIRSRTGAYIMGKQMFNEGEVNWSEDLFKADVYVLTHTARAPWVQKGTTTFFFETDGMEATLEKARRSANGKDVRIMGGGHTIQQFLNAGLIDDFMIHITPIVLGSGLRLFDQLDRSKVEVAIDEVIPAATVSHLKYKVLNK